MSRALATIVTLAWALWFGGVVTLFIAVSSIFKTFHPDRALAGTAAAGVFHAFERYQLALAAVAVVAAVLWRLTGGRRPGAGIKTAVAALLALAAVAALVESFHVAPQIERLRVEKRTAEDAFKNLHGASMILYTSGAAVLLVAGLLVPAAVCREAGTRET